MSYHWKRSYKKHLNISYYCGNTIPSENISYLHFNQWLTFYNADPEHWDCIVNKECDVNSFSGVKYYFYYYIPYYKYFSQNGRYITGRHFIKFLTRKDYKKFVKFMITNEEKGTDYQNQQEILKLSQVIGRESAKRLEAAQNEVQKAYEENKRIMERATKDILGQGGK